MKRSPLLRSFVMSILAGSPVFALANEPPLIEHQPGQCSIFGKPIELCASVFDDGEVAKVRTYFRKPGEKGYLVSEMAFEGARFCTTLPPVKAGKLKALEYYIQAVDTEYESKRTGTYELLIQNEGDCSFPAVQKDPQKAGSIRIYATSDKQGSKIPSYLEPEGVTFVPVPGARK